MRRSGEAGLAFYETASNPLVDDPGFGKSSFFRYAITILLSRLYLQEWKGRKNLKM